MDRPIWETWDFSVPYEARHKWGAKRGDEHPSSKITEDQVLEIQRRILAGERQSALAAEFGVSPATVSLIKHGKCRKYLAERGMHEEV